MRPAFFNSALSKSVTSGTQPPQPVPALVQHLRESSVSEPSRTAAQIAPFDTLLQEQTWAASDNASRPMAAPLDPLAPTSSSCGLQGSGASLLLSMSSLP